MATHLTLRLQFGPHQDVGEITAQLLQLVDDAPVDEIMFFFFGEEQNNGHEPLERIQQWLEHSRPYRAALNARGVAVSLNPWHTLLHGDAGRTLKPGQTWQRMVDPTGRTAQAVVCPLDPHWQAYYLDTLRLYAGEGFRTVWIDDDIRYHNHQPLAWGGCFCSLHVAAFNARAGTDARREEIVQACLAPGRPHPWRAIWFDMWQGTILAFLTACREILEGGGTRMGLMSSSMEAHAAEGRRWGDWWRAFGGGYVHRPHFWGYSDALGAHLIHGIAALDQNRTIQPAEVDSGPEIENFPYGWSKSFRQTFAQMAVAQISGATHLNVSLFDFMGNRPDDEPERAAFLRRVRPNLDWLADTFPSSLKSVGVGVPWTEEMGRGAHLPENAGWVDLQIPSRGWAYWLGAAGIAFSARAQEKVNALAGPLAWSIDEETLKGWLSAGLLLDGVAAEILAARGFGTWMGVKAARRVTQQEVLYAIEDLHAPFAFRAGGQISVNHKKHTQSLLQAELMPGVTVISQLRNPVQEVVGHGAFCFENDWGGRVAVVPWNASVSEVPMMDVHRAGQLRRIVTWLGAGTPGGVEEGACVPQFLTDGKTWRGVIWNISPDEMEALTVHRPPEMPPLREAWHLTPKGARLPVPVTGDKLQLSRPMHQWEFVVLIP